MECYICMNDERPLIKLPCACKNLPIHPKCLQEWLKHCSDILQCSICKKDLKPSFIQQFVSIEEIWKYPKSYISLPGMIVYDLIGEPGIPHAILVNGEMIFNNIKQESIFLQAEKQYTISERRKNHSKIRCKNNILRRVNRSYTH